MWQIRYTHPWNGPNQWGLELSLGRRPGSLGNRITNAFDTAKQAYDAYLDSRYCTQYTDGLREYAVCIKHSYTDEIAFAQQPNAEYSQVSWLVEKNIFVPPIEPEPGAVHMIKTYIKREAGKLMLLVEAQDFHAELDKIGCTATNGVYDNRPAAGAGVANNRFEMSTECLLKKQYPAKFELSGIWTTPPTTANLTTLCESAYQAARKILDHYQPIDISIEIQKKILK